MITVQEKRGRGKGKGWRPVPQSPCLCVRRGKWGRCGICGSVVVSEKEIGSALCNACAGSIANSTELETEGSEEGKA